MQTSLSIEILKRYIAKNIPFLFLLLLYEINGCMAAWLQSSPKTITCHLEPITCHYREIMAGYHLTGELCARVLSQVIAVFQTVFPGDVLGRCGEALDEVAASKDVALLL